MEIISIILALIAVLASFTLVASIIMLFVRNWRRKGKRLALLSLATIIVAPAIGMNLDGQQDEEEQITAKENTQETQQLTDTKSTEDTSVKALNGFPDQETLSTAKSLGINRYEAYKLLKDETVITRYCAYSAQANILEQDKHSQMDAVQSEDAKNAIWDKYEKLQKQLIDSLNNDTGMVGLEYVQASIAGHWPFYCRAAEDNWSVITEEQAKAATRSDAKEAKDALNAFYLLNLNEEASPFFSKQRYSAVSCDWENHNDMRFVGCQLVSLNYKSNWQMFLVGRLDNGKLAVNPINGDTSGKLDVTQARFYDEVSGKHIFIQAYEQPRAYLAKYAGARIDIKAVRDLFK